MLKKIGVIALTCSILFSVNVFADQKQVLEEEWNYTFEEEKEWLEELDVEDDDIKVLENLFNEALKKDTDEAWKNYDEYLNKLLPEDMEDDFDIEEEKEWLEELQVSQADMSALETLFNEAIALEEADKFDEADVKWTAYEEILEKYYDAFEFTFDDEVEWLKEMGVSDADVSALETLFNEAIALEEADKFDEADVKWAAYEEILEKYYDAFEFTFDDEVEWLKEMGVSDADMSALETLFNEAIALEEADKFDEADVKWAAYEEILEKYYDAFEFTFDDEVEWLKEIGVTDADIVALKTFYNDAIALEEADKMDEAEKKWIAFDEILDKYEDAFDEEEDYSVEEEKAWLKEIGVSDADIDTLVLLFNEALVLEEAEKFEEAENKWVTYDEILDKYFDLEDME